MMQFVDLHSISHDDDDSDCAVCDFAFNMIDDFTPTCEIIMPEAAISIADMTNTLYVSQPYSSIFFELYLNKAPPLL